MKNAFNSVSSPSSLKNALPQPKFPSGFLDKRGRMIKTEEDFATAERRLADGRKARYRAGKAVHVDPLPSKYTQEEKKKELSQNVDRHAEGRKSEIKRKADKFQL